MTQDSDSPPEREGRLTLFPMFLPAGTTVTGMFFAPLLPWMAPALSGVVGHPSDEPGRVTAMIAYEWPIPHWTILGDPLEKEAVERLHLERYRTDCLLATGELPYVALEPGANPPDFDASLPDGSSVGVDCTQFTASGRIAAQAQFERIRRAVLAESRAHFTHLRGHLLYLWFETEGDLGLPHREAAAVEEVVAALREYQPDTSWTEMPPAEAAMPERLGETDMQSTDSGCRFYAAELRGAVPGTDFFATAGFEMALAYQTAHTVSEVWAELRRLIERHDKPEIQHLVVTVGGPNRRGLAYPSEDFLMDMALIAGPPTFEPRHITSVVIHSWSDGRVIPLYPALEEAEPLYPGGYVVPHYSLMPPPEAHPATEQVESPNAQRED